MATVDELVIKIRADLKDANKKLKELEKGVSNTTNKVSGGFKRIASIAKVAIGAVVVQQLGRATMALVNFAGDVDELRSKSGAVFREFTDEVRSELSKFGDEVGRSTHELEGMASSVQDTFVPMGFARGEAAKLSTSLTKLAVDVASFNNAQDDETMQAFQSALVGNHEAVRRFGIVITETELKNELLRMGITKTYNEIDAQTKVQARLNLIMAGTKDAQGDAARTAGSFANLQKGLRGELSELADEVGLTLVPAFSELTEMLITATKNTKNFLRSFGIATPRLETITEIQDEVETLREEIKKTERMLAQSYNFRKFFGLDTEGGVFGNKKKELELEVASLKDAQNILRKNVQMQKQIAEEGRKTRVEAENTNAVDDLAMSTIKKTLNIENLKTLKDQFVTERRILEYVKANMPENIKLKGIELDLHRNRLRDQAIAIIQAEKEEELIKKAVDFTKSLTTEMESLETMQRALNLARDHGIISDIAYTKGMEDVQKKMEELGKTTAEFSDLNQAFLDVAVSVGNTLESSFIDTLSGTKSALESFKDMSRQLVEEILKIYMRMSVINPIIRSIFGTQPGFDADAFPVADPSAIFEKGKNLLTGRASGGPVRAGQPYMVGERGPEMFVPNQSGNIIPNGAKGTVVNQSINFATGIQNTVRAEVMNLMPMIKNATLSAVVDQKRRGGAFAQGLT